MDDLRDLATEIAIAIVVCAAFSIAVPLIEPHRWVTAVALVSSLALAGLVVRHVRRTAGFRDSALKVAGITLLLAALGAAGVGIVWLTYCPC